MLVRIVSSLACCALAASVAFTPARAGQVPENPPSATSPLITPDARDADKAPPETGAEKADADRTLRAKGLRRQGPMYLLDKEDEVKYLANSLAVIAQGAQDAWAQMVKRDQQITQLQASLNGLRQQQQNLIAANEVAAMLAAQVAARPADPNAQQPENEEARKRELQRAQEEARRAAGNRSQLIFNLENEFGRQWASLMQVQNEFNRLDSYFRARQNELRQGEVDLGMMVEQVRKRYQDLARDTEVKSALNTLNRDSSRIYALGPLEDYRTNARKLAMGVLEKKGFEAKKGGGIVLGADEDLKMARSLVKSIQHELGVALSRQLGLQREAAFRVKRMADFEAQETGLAAQLAATPPAQKPTLESKLKGVRAELARMSQQESDGAKALKAAAQDIAGKREGFLQSVEILRKAHDASVKKNAEVGGDREVKQMIGALKAKGPRKPARKDAAQPPPELKDAEKFIQVEEVALVPDRTALWVTATVNAVPDRKFVLDPAVDTVRVSERFAASVNLVPAPGEALSVVTVTMPDGQKIQARRATLRTVTLGTLTLPNVACLVMLEGFDAPPVLGASFLDQFVTKIDNDTNKLTLTQVKVPPYAGKVGTTKVK